MADKPPPLYSEAYWKYLVENQRISVWKERLDGYWYIECDGYGTVDAVRDFHEAILIADKVAKRIICK